MEKFELWAVYSNSTEQWTKEFGSLLMGLVDNPNVEVVIKYMAHDDETIIKYSWKRFPLFVCVKHGQPSSKIIGKHELSTYINWFKEINWKIN